MSTKFRDFSSITATLGEPDSALRDVANSLVALITMSHANPTVVPEVVQLAPRITKVVDGAVRMPVCMR